MVDFMIAYGTDVMNQIIGYLAFLRHLSRRSGVGNLFNFVPCSELLIVINSWLVSLLRLYRGYLLKLSQMSYYFSKVFSRNNRAGTQLAR